MLARYDLSRDTAEALLARSAVPDPGVRHAARDICRQVRDGGDAVLGRLGSELGGGFRRVAAAEMEAAAKGLDIRTLEAIQASIEAVEMFHSRQLPGPVTVATQLGVEITRAWAPLRRIGAYVPGGKAAYPSTVIMTSVPARLAGVTEIVVASPSDAGHHSPALLAAANLAGVSELWSMGGAQAIAALAYGTESVGRVDKIVGPGNAWVTAAKLEVFGDCAVDLPAGPSEVLVIADSTASPRMVAIDLLCQAEHGPDSPAILVTTDPALADAVDREIEEFLPRLERRDILAKALTDHGAIVTAPDIDGAVEFANRYAPEHATVLTSDPERVASAITAAGSIYVGRWAPESAGDYATGANHVLPTGGLAKAYGPLSTIDFGSWRQIQRIDRTGLETITPTISALAEAEGLTAHALAATIRLEEIE